MERMITDSCNRENTSYVFRIIAICRLFRHSKVTSQLSLLLDALKTGNTDYKMGIKKVTTLNTVCQLFETCKFLKTMLNEVHKVLQIYPTIPLSLSTAERAFSTL